MKKATITKLNKLAKQNNYTAQLLKEIINQATNHDELVKEGFDSEKTGAWAFNLNDGIYVRVQNEYDKRVLRGLSTYNEKYMQVSFTHGLNECKILDIDRVVSNLFVHN